MMNAYLTPHLPAPRLVRRVEAALRTFETMLEESVADDAGSLPDFDMVDGTITGAEGRVA